MTSPTIIPNLYCSWYISGGPSNQTIEIGKPPQIQNGTCVNRRSEVGYLSQPVGMNVGLGIGTTSINYVPVSSHTYSYVQMPTSHCAACGK